MRRYWLMDQHGGKGPTALVETDGGLHVVDVVRFGPEITELDEQQKVWDRVIGKVAPTLRPLVDASSIDEEGVAPHAELWRGHHDRGAPNRSARRSGGGRRPGVGRAGGGPGRTGSRGDR